MRRGDYTAAKRRFDDAYWKRRSSRSLSTNAGTTFTGAIEGPTQRDVRRFVQIAAAAGQIDVTRKKSRNMSENIIDWVLMGILVFWFLFVLILFLGGGDLLGVF